MAKIYVAKTPNSGNSISATTAQDLGLISLHINKVTELKDKKLGKIISKHSKVFRDLGKLKGEQIKLNIDQTQTPKAQPQRRIPYHVQDKIESALEDLESNDIIERLPENTPTLRVSPIKVVPKKNGNVRIYVDMRLANNP